MIVVLSEKLAGGKVSIFLDEIKILTLDRWYKNSGLLVVSLYIVQNDTIPAQLESVCLFTLLLKKIFT